MALYHQTNILYSSIRRTVRQPVSAAKKAVLKPAKAVLNTASSGVMIGRSKYDSLRKNIQTYNPPVWIRLPAHTGA